MLNSKFFWLIPSGLLFLAIFGLVLFAGGSFFSESANSPERIVPETEQAKYANDYILALALVHEKIAAADTSSDDGSMTEILTETLFEERQTINAIERAMRLLESYKNSDTTLIASHADATLAAFSALHGLHTNYITATETVMLSEDSAGVDAYLVELSRLLPSIDEVIKTFPEIVLLLSVAVLHEEYDFDENRVTRMVLLDRIEESFGDLIGDDPQAGQHAFVASVAFLRDILEERN